MNKLKYYFTPSNQSGLPIASADSSILLGLIMAFLFNAMPLKMSGQSLAHYQEIAAKANPELKAAYLEFEAALQRVPQMGSLDDPRLTMSAFGRMIETRVGRQEARFTLTQMFPWFGTLKDQKAGAASLAEALFSSYLDMRALVQRDVANVYYDLYQVDKTMALERENLTLLQDIRELALTKYKTGGGNLTEVLSIDLMINESRSAIDMLRTEQSMALAELGQFLGEIQHQAPVFPDDLWQNQAGAIISDPSFDRHPALQAWQYQIDAAQSNVLLAKKNSLPNIEVGLDYSVIAKRLDEHPVGNGRDAVMPMVGLSLPIYRKKYDALAKESELMLENAHMRQQQIKNQLTAQYTTAQASLEKASIQQALFEKQVTTTQEMLELMKVQYATAKSDMQDLLMTRQVLVGYKKEKLEAEIERLKALAELDYLINSSKD